MHNLHGGVSPARRWTRLLVALLLFGTAAGATVWHKLFREVPQPASITANEEQNFLYGSIGSEGAAGIPYWIMVVLPRIFSDYLPGPGGYASFGLPWEEGRELPVGFSKKTVGFERVGFNCSICHAAQYRLSEHEPPHIVAGGGNHTANVQQLIEFLSRCAADPRFNADTILKEIDFAYRLSPVDRLMYRYLLIPIFKREAIAQGRTFAWTASRPAWGPGRDAPMNLTKFSLLNLPHDESVDNSQFPALWHFETRIASGRVWPENDFSETADFSKLDIAPTRLMLMNLGGESTSFRTVLIDSILGMKGADAAFVRRRATNMEAWLRQVPAPKYPVPATGAELGSQARGQEIFEQRCSSCHAAGRDNRMGTVIPLEEIRTDPERVKAWTKEAADAANKVVASTSGIGRTPMGRPPKPGYVAVQMDGIWLRAPYLHNGSVPTLRALLEPAACRPQTFYSGYDVIDRENVGFVSQRCGETPSQRSAACGVVQVQTGCMPPGKGWRYDTGERGNHNGGHEYGTTLPDADKKALIAFLKTL